MGHVADAGGLRPVSLLAGQDILAQNEVAGQVAREVCKNRDEGKTRAMTSRRCSICGKPGHNARTTRRMNKCLMYIVQIKLEHLRPCLWCT